MTELYGDNVENSHLDRNCKRHDSKTSVATDHSAQSQHQEYISRLRLPSVKSMERIAAVQERKEHEVLEKRLSNDHNDMADSERTKAASLIQRNYRGYRERRQLNGLGLDPTTRWVEAIKEARYRNLTTPRPRGNTGVSLASDGIEKSVAARQNWKKVGTITRRAGGDEEGVSDSSEEENDDGLSEEQKKEKRRMKMEQKAARQKTAKMMDLQYFLEMVDVRHRYGSNLRTYHQEWKKADTTENFFYWLDYGEGKDVEMAGCPRERLDRECVRYLSKEERLNYLVKIDEEGRLCWARNGVRIDTTEEYKDSIHGIVPVNDPSPAYQANKTAADPTEETMDSSERPTTPLSPSSISHEDEDHEAAAGKYTDDKLQSAPTIKKIKYVSAATIFNKLLRSSVKKNTWLFVADTSFRLYVGIKQSGAFQHSSFLHGSRISAAGLIKIKNGRLSKLSPLSGHYRPPVSNFRSFEHSLKDRGVDMSHVSISRSYAVLVGLEAYVKTRRKGKSIVRHLIHGRDKLLDPEETRRKDLEEQDKSESAKRERKFLEKEAERQRREEEERDENLSGAKFMRKLGIGTRVPRVGYEGNDHEEEEGKDGVGEERAADEITENMKHDKKVEVSNEGLRDPGPGAEDGIAPEGKR